MAKRLKISDFEERPPKLTYIIYRYVWENINNPAVVANKADKQSERDIEAFALTLIDMHENLGNALN